MEVLREVLVVFALPLLPLVVSLDSCAAGRPMSVVDETHAAVK